MTDTAENIPTTLDRLTIPITQLTPRKGNPRRGNIDVIAESLQRNGQYRPIVVNKPTSEVLAGNHTLAAAKQLGWTRIAVTFVDVDDDQAARIVLADNRTADLGTYDDAALYRMLQALDDGLEGTGYDAQYVNDLHLRLEDRASLPDFQPDDAEPSRLDQTATVTCPACGEAFAPDLYKN